MAKVLIIEDDAVVAETLKDWLETQGHLADIAYTGTNGLLMLEQLGWDLAIIDWQLPGMGGPDICANYRKNGGRAPILMLTHKSSVFDKQQGLDSGADDYLPKPFDLIELGARVRALLRRSTGLFDSHFRVGRLVLDKSKCMLSIDGRECPLVPREFALVEFLMRHPDTYFTADKLLDHVWDSSVDVGHEALRTCISRIRAKVDMPGKPSVIENAKGWGYKISSTYLTEKEKQ